MCSSRKSDNLITTDAPPRSGCWVRNIDPAMSTTMARPILNSRCVLLSRLGLDVFFGLHTIRITKPVVLQLANAVAGIQHRLRPVGPGPLAIQSVLAGLAEPCSSALDQLYFCRAHRADLLIVALATGCFFTACAGVTENSFFARQGWVSAAAGSQKIKSSVQCLLFFSFLLTSSSTLWPSLTASKYQVIGYTNSVSSKSAFAICSVVSSIVSCGRTIYCASGSAL